MRWITHTYRKRTKLNPYEPEESLKRFHQQENFAYKRTGLYSSSDASLLSNLTREIVDTECLEVYNKFRSRECELEWFFDENPPSDSLRDQKPEFDFNFDFDVSSQLSQSSEGEVEFLLTPLEEPPDFCETITKNQFLQKLKNALLPRYSADLPCSYDLFEDESFEPVSLRIPVSKVDEKGGLERNARFHKLEHNRMVDPKIKFSRFADVLVYNCNGEAPIAKPNTLNITEMNPRDSRNNAKTGYVTIATSDPYSPPYEENEFYSATMPKKTSILKNKTNHNYDVETLQLREIDKVNFESFINNFEKGEFRKLGQESFLNNCRLKQLRNYYMHP